VVEAEMLDEGGNVMGHGLDAERPVAGRRNSSVPAGTAHVEPVVGKASTAS
jgi:hypothetical protein